MSVFHMPLFDVESWNPQGPAGLNYMSLVPFSPSSGPSQDSQFGKMKVSSSHRKQRLKGFQSRKTSCRNVVGMYCIRNKNCPVKLLLKFLRFSLGIDYLNNFIAHSSICVYYFFRIIMTQNYQIFF